MWYPPPILIPFYFEPNLRSSSDVSTITMRQTRPFHQHMYLAMNSLEGNLGHSVHIDDGRKFLLNKSVFDLVNVSDFLELTDPKLLGWYLSLPLEDRQLIQEQGGLIHFLQRHPALEVSRHIVHLKQQILGSCLPLPVTDMSSKLNKSRRPTFYGVLQCLNCGTSCPSGAKKCRRCNELILNLDENVGISEEEKTLGLLPNSVREELNLLKAKKQEAFVRSPEQLGGDLSISNDSQRQMTSVDGSQQAFDSSYAIQTFVDQQGMHSTKAQLLSQMWEEGVRYAGTDVTVFQDSSAQANLSLDMELDMESYNQIRSQCQEPVSAGTDADLTRLDQETPENRTSLEHSSAEWSDATASLELCYNDSIIATKGSTEVSTGEHAEHFPASGAENFHDSVSCASNSSEWTDFTEDYQDLSSQEEPPKVGKCHCAVEGGSSLVTHASSVPCTPNCINPKRAASMENTVERDSACEESFMSVGQEDLHVATTKHEKCDDVSPVPLLVSQAVDASSDFRECFTSTRATEISQGFLARSRREASSGSDSFTINRDQETQTIQVSAHEKCTITEVCMSDLDVVSEHGKLKMMEKELKHLKDTVARGACVEGAGGEQQNRACACDGVRRAQRAELRLLALQFAMCLQHCWRRYYTSPHGEAALQGTEALPDVMAQTLKCLEEDYSEAKLKILAGVPLENLKPLSVDSQRIAIGTCYTPVLIAETYLEDVQLEASSCPSSLAGGGKLCQAGEGVSIRSAGNRLHSRTTTAEDNAHPQFNHQAGGSKKTRAVSVLEQQPIVSCEIKAGVPKGLNCSDAWFDAEEELQSSGQMCKEEQEARWREREELKMKQKEDKNESQTSFLCITGLPSNVTECDLLLWCGKYHAFQVCITTFNSKNSAAIVSVKSPTDAETAVREMNGQSIQGHTLHVEHIQSPSVGGQRPVKESCSEHPPAAHKTRPTGQGPRTHGSQSNVHFSRPLRCSLDKLTNIHNTPTASGTFVPQHYATMGSFDTIMARLSERHPEVGRHRIVGALLKLRAKHQQVLSGLPLTEIVDMTSNLLTVESTTK